MSEYPFDCPVCLWRFWINGREVYDERYDDTVCHMCAEEPMCEYWLAEQKKAPLEEGANVK